MFAATSRITLCFSIILWLQFRPLYLEKVIQAESVTESSTSNIIHRLWWVLIGVRGITLTWPELPQLIGPKIRYLPNKKHSKSLAQCMWPIQNKLNTCPNPKARVLLHQVDWIHGPGHLGRFGRLCLDTNYCIDHCTRFMRTGSI